MNISGKDLIEYVDKNTSKSNFLDKDRYVFILEEIILPEVVYSLPDNFMSTMGWRTLYNLIGERNRVIKELEDICE